MMSAPVASVVAPEVKAIVRALDLSACRDLADQALAQTSPQAIRALAQAFELDPLQTHVLLAFSALPTASSAYVLASRMGYDGGYVAGLVTLSTLLGVFSLPYALSLL